MESVIVIYSDSSSDSVKELEPPKKLPPPLIDIDVDEVILNVTKNTIQSPLDKFFKNDEIPKESPGDHPSHWTDDMKKFYNDDWGDEESFIVEKMQEKMDKHPYLWQVSEKDMVPRNKKRRNYLKCLNCCQYGHTMYNCNEPLHIPKCHMCGQAGHLDKRCPNSICLNCGNQVRSYVKKCSKCSTEVLTECVRCSLPGHHFINCSDNWRRFHATVGKIETDIPGGIIYKSANNVWCCNCGKKGHYGIDCKMEKPPDFPETSPFVASYDNMFNAQHRSNSVPVPRMLHMNQISTQKKGGVHFHGKYQRNQHPNGKCLNKLQQIKKHKKKKKKKDKDKNRNRFPQTLDFIPI